MRARRLLAALALAVSLGSAPAPAWPMPDPELKPAAFLPLVIQPYPVPCWDVACAPYETPEP
jgi:hypothetical protein